MKNEIINKVEEKIRENGPSILTGLGVIGLISTVGLAIKATHDFDKEENKTKEDKVKSIFKYYWPVVVLGAGSVSCIIVSNSMNMKRNLALAGAYKLSEEKVKEYKDKLFGVTKEKNEEKVKQNIVIFGDSDIDCYDPLTGRYFKSNILEIKEAMEHINKMMYYGEKTNLNDFYSKLDLDDIELYTDMNWDVNDGPIELVFGSELTEKMKPVLVIDFNIRPVNENVY
jgi:predicted alpha/beta hydrolase family esterase